MSSIAEAQALIDAATTTRLAGENVIKGNQDDSDFSNGSQPYATQRVIWTDHKQLVLGNLDATRHEGYLLFVIYTPKGAGDGQRNTLLDKVVKSFKSQPIGDVSMRGRVRTVNQGSSGQWSLTGVQIPFYTDEI